MSRLSVLEQFRNLSSWHRGAEEAPHKPLLVLYALGRYQQPGAPDEIPFTEVARRPTDLLKEFGLSRNPRRT